MTGGAGKKKRKKILPSKQKGTTSKEKVQKKKVQKIVSKFMTDVEPPQKTKTKGKVKVFV